MRRVCAVLVLCSVSSLVAAQAAEPPPDTDAQLADAWMLELEDRLDSSDSVMKYFAAPLLILDGVILSGLAVGADQSGPAARGLLGGAGALWFASGVGYYASDDPEHGRRLFGGVANLGSAFLYGSVLAFQSDCGSGGGITCGNRGGSRDQRTFLSSIAGFGLAFSVLAVAYTVLVEPPRLADLRVGFESLDAGTKRQRLIEHLRAEEDLKWNVNAVAIALCATGSGVMTHLALRAESDDGQLLLGGAAAYLGATAIGSLLWLLLSTPDSERVLAGELPEE